MARLVKRYQLLVFLSLIAATTTVTVVHAHIDSLGLPCGMRDECGFLPSLACIHGVCSYCHTDDDCTTVGEAIHRCHPVQSNDQSTGGLCFEKDLFDPFTANDVLATAITLVATALGSGCGVGGGGLLVPAFILVIGLSPKHAIPLSKAAIFGNAVATYLFNIFRKHPLKKNVPLINYDVASIMEPTTLIGSVVGVMLNHILPDWLILVLLVSFLAYTTKHAFLKGEEIRFAETLHQQALIRQVLTGNKSGGGGQGAWSVLKRFDWEAAGRHWLTLTRRNRRLRALLAADQADFKSLPPLPEDATPLLLASNMASPAFGTFDASGSDDAASSEIRQRLQRHEAVVLPLRAVLPLLLCWFIVLLQALLRGGHGSASLIGVQCNTLAYWGLTIAPLLVLVLITWRVGYRLRLENRLRVFSGYDFLPSDIHWTKPHVTTFPLLCTAAGVAAGLLGIGGGMVKSPLMLEMGILPAVQTATAGYMVLFTASSTTLQFAIGGQFPGALQYDYAAWFALVGFIGGLCGQSLVAFIVKRYKRESIMVYILAGTIGVSTIAMGLVGLSNVLDDLERGVGVGFNSLCGNA